jgi:hypothetical protein
MNIERGLMRALSILATSAIVMTAMASLPAEAAKKSKRSVYENQRYVYVGRTGRPRVTVTRRSFLDAGTEVRPGDRKFTDYTLPIGYLSQSPIDPFRPGEVFIFGEPTWIPGYRPFN